MGKVTCDYDSILGVSLFHVKGQVGPDDIIQAFESHILEYPVADTIWDLREADLSELDIDGLKRIELATRRTWTSRGEGARTAFIANKQAERILMELYRTITTSTPSPIHYKIFSASDEARAWLKEGE